MFYEDVMKEIIFDCKMRNLSSRTIRSYRQNSNTLFHYLKTEYDINDIEDVIHKNIQLYYIGQNTSKNQNIILTRTYVCSIIQVKQA